MLSATDDYLYLNKKLFARVKALHDRSARLNLSTERAKLLDWPVYSNALLRTPPARVRRRGALVSAPCTLSAKVVPSCGALWGITTESPTAAALAAAETAAGRPFDIVYRFHDINNAVPTEEERAIVDRGGLLHLSVDARDYGSVGGSVTWSAIAAGNFDDDLRAQAAGIALLHKPVFLTFEHEADQQAKEALGSGPEFVAAWRHVHGALPRPPAPPTPYGCGS